MVPLGSKLVIFGGYGGAGAHRRMADVLVYDVPSGTVRQLPISGMLCSCDCKGVSIYRFFKLS
jgi:hypothetical protein